MNINQIIGSNQTFNNELNNSINDINKINNNSTFNNITKKNLKSQSEQSNNTWINGTANKLIRDSTSAIEDRENNLKKLEDINNLIIRSTNSMNTESKNYYDKRICEEWKKLKELNDKFDLNTKIIEINNEKANNYDFYISILKATILGCVFYLLFFLVYTIKKTTFYLKFGLFFVIIYIIIYIFYLNTTDKSRIIKKNITTLTEDTTRGLVRAASINLLPKQYYRCPSNCKINRDKLPPWESSGTLNNLDIYCSNQN